MRDDEMMSAEWVLECGCDPHVQHCDQCDSRRRMREAYERGHHPERLAERAAIVAWLRERAERSGGDGLYDPDELADGIERGEHEHEGASS